MARPEPRQLKVHENAASYLDETVARLGEAISAFARGKALQEGADEVQTSHMKRAEALLGDGLGPSRTKQLAVVVGSVLVGAFVSGVIQEVSGDKRTAELSLYFAMGPVGLLTTFWGIHR